MPHSAVPAHLAEPSTRRLDLRRMTWDDLDRIHAWESDPTSFTHAPQARHTSIEQTRDLMQRWIGSWEQDGLSYWIAERRDTGLPVGFGGIRATRHGFNLAYRLDEAHRGHGYAAEIARTATALATEWCPGREVYAMIRPVNTASLRTAERAGLWLTDERPEQPPPDGAEPALIYLLPRMLAGSDDVVPEAPVYAEALDLWCAVNEAGGSVGFEGAAPRDDVAVALDEHLVACASGTAVMGRLVHPQTGALLGLAFWTVFSNSKVAHIGVLKRVMVDPRHRGRNLGSVLMGGMHAIARDHGVEVARLNYRGGTGVGAFYETCGYREIGRLPRGLRFTFGDVDDVDMARRLDGHPL
ncbi:GNAT family N-acetyltransferase [Leekyejoonella antrihumi]|uniref:GNAT family N-acetyltransferase n=1 Tax=Leekyejoonella antrihumi TaxID=1660198 RepID=A0A563E5Z4_9MICO|nr:GNAT family N-acetyltransferase [Leekyejoonella antrihumi]TWP37855.1 GNAT family N-acetyltransferase [Leekyejoonella antrihumi]